MERLKSIFWRVKKPRTPAEPAPKVRQPISSKSPEQIIPNPDLFAQFLLISFLDFFQQVDTGPIETLPNFIKNTPPDSFPPNLRRTQKKLFVPLFKQLNGKAEKDFDEIGERGLLEICQMLCQQIEESQIPLNASVQNEYQLYIQALNQLPKSSQPASPKEKKRKSPPQNPEVSKLPIPPEKKSKPPAFQIVLGVNQEPREITSQEELEDWMQKIKRLGPITPEFFWKKLLKLQASLWEDPKQIPIRYNERVAGGPFKGWRKIAIGGKWWIIFQIQDNQITFRIGDHKDVYGTRQPGKDKSRSL